MEEKSKVKSKKPKFLLLGFGILALFCSICILPFGFQRNLSKASQPKRIVSLAPSITETLFALGLDSEVAGVTNFCDYPANALAKKRVGGFTNPNIEAIVSLQPDLVIVTMDGNPQKIAEELKQQDINILVIKTDNFGDIITSTRQIGEATGRGDKADKIVSEIQSEIGQISKAVAKRNKVKVLLVYDHEPIIAVGKNNFGNDIINLCGGENISEGFVKYPRLDMEFIVAKQPEVIIETGMLSNSKVEELLAFWNKWSEIPAVRNKKVYFMDSALIARPGPRIVEGMKKIAHYLHPEAF